jgi:phenylacetate-coenzyme A ligase PaaK-like adenylate-forming protein
MLFFLKKFVLYQGNFGLLRNHLYSLLFQCGATRRNRSEIVGFRNKQIRKIVCHAYDNVEYYRCLFDDHGIDPQSIRNAGDLCAIPATSKEDVRRVPVEAMFEKGRTSAELIPHTTSATTGVPSVTYRTRLEENLLAGYRWRGRHYLGLRPSDRIAFVYFEPPRPNLTAYLFSKLGFYNGTFICCMDSPKDVLGKLHKANPDVIMGYPGTLYEAAMQMRIGEKGPRPRLVITGGETLTLAMRSEISTAFNARVLNNYGCFEMNYLAWECMETGELHTCDDSMIMEIIKDGRPARRGELGEVVVTGLHSFAMPLIRYRLGDMAVQGSETCACGLPFSTIQSIEGRKSDYFILPDGEKIHSFSLFNSIVKYVYPAILKYQVVQERTDDVVLRLVTREDVEQSTLKDLTDAGRRILGPSIKFEVQVVDKIKTSKTGKVITYQTLVKQDRIG